VHIQDLQEIGSVIFENADMLVYHIALCHLNDDLGAHIVFQQGIVLGAGIPDNVLAHLAQIFLTAGSHFL
jgi:hypothetical protein